MPTPLYSRRLIPAEIPMEELKRDARTIRAIIRKYSINPSQYSAILPLHPTSIVKITRTRCIEPADIIDAMYGRDYIYSLFDPEETTEEGLNF
jgi:hypothetical protein